MLEKHSGFGKDVSTIQTHKWGLCRWERVLEEVVVNTPLPSEKFSGLFLFPVDLSSDNIYIYFNLTISVI